MKPVKGAVSASVLFGEKFKPLLPSKQEPVNKHDTKEPISKPDTSAKMETRTARSLVEVSHSYKPQGKNQRIMTKVNVATDQPRRKRMKVHVLDTCNFLALGCIFLWKLH